MSDDKVFPLSQKTYKYRGIPEPEQTVESLQNSVTALKEVVETMAGLRGEGVGSINDYATDGRAVGGHVNLGDPHAQYVLESVGLQVWAFAAYGGMVSDGSEVPFPDIGAGWQTIDVASVLTVAEPRGVTVSIPNSSLSFSDAGVYALSVAGSFGHTELNSGRTTRLRTFNITTGTPGARTYPLGTGRNTAITQFGLTLLVDITSDVAGQEIVIQIGGGDSYTNVEFYAYALEAWSVGEYRGGLTTQRV